MGVAIWQDKVVAALDSRLLIYELPPLWQYGDLSGHVGAPDALGDPAGYARSDGTNSVVYRGTNNHIYELYLSGGTWLFGDLSGNARDLSGNVGAPDALGDPAGYARSDGTNSVVYRGANNHIYELYLSGDPPWKYGDLCLISGAPDALGDPAGYACSDRTNSVVYRGANDHIYELFL